MALSKWLPATYPLVRTILHGVGLIIMIGWPHSLWKTGMIPPCHLDIQNVTYPLEISFWIRNIFTHGRPLPGCFSSTAKPPVHRVDVVYRDVITGSRESRDHLLSFTEFWNLYCPNIIFHSDGERRQGRCRRPWLSETWRTMIPWWRHQIETVSALLAISVGNSPHKDQWRGALMFSLICVWINGWVNNGEAVDLRRYRAHYDVTVMYLRFYVHRMMLPTGRTLLAVSTASRTYELSEVTRINWL